MEMILKKGKEKQKQKSMQKIRNGFISYFFDLQNSSSLLLNINKFLCFKHKE